MTAFAGNLMIQYAMDVKQEIEDMDRDVNNRNSKRRMKELAQLCIRRIVPGEHSVLKRRAGTSWRII
jgi:hypothetical protein